MNSKINKILYVRNGPYKVNMNSYNLQEIGFSKELCKKGINCDIIYYTDEKSKIETIYRSKESAVRILWTKGIKVLRTGLYPSLLKRSFVNQYDLIITTEYSQIMSLIWTFFKPKVVLYNGPYYNLFKIPFVEKIYDKLFVNLLNNRLDKIFVKSQLSKEYMEKKGFNNTIVLGVGLDTSVFQKEVEIPENIESIISTMKNNKCILYVGSLDERKNTKFLFQVFEKIQNRNKNIKLILIGKGKEKYLSQCFKEVSDSTKENIVHIDRVQNKYLKSIYENAEVFILPSVYEIFGMVLLEAMYFGLPVISSKNGGSTTLINDNINGLVIENYDIELWAKEISRILCDDDYRRNMGISAKKTINDNFTWEKISSRFIEHILSFEEEE